ncbi:MAG: DUF424 family protein [Sulfolobales archaeon]
MVILRVYIKVVEVYEGGSLRKIVGVCDEDLLGKVFRDGDLVLEINEEFFGGDIVEIDEAIALVESSNSALAVGKNIVSKLIEVGLTHPMAVSSVSGVPYTIILRYES